MRRASPALPVSPAMLRHFAAATGVITLVIAMFVQGAGTGAPAAKPQATGNSGSAIGGMFGGTEAQALNQAKVGKPAREINGMKIAPGTTFGGGSDGDESGGSGQGSGGGGGGGRAAPGLARTAAAQPPLTGPPGDAPAMIKDRNGVPAPAVSAALGKQRRPSNNEAPRLASPADYDHMMAESQRRSGTASHEQ